MEQDSSIPKIHQSWKKVLYNELNSQYFKDLNIFLLKEKKHHTIFPAVENIFSAFNKTTFEQVKVVIIGQDPYHGDNQAHGLSFSVPEGIKLPPSLKNIFKEINVDLGKGIPESGNLERWADQGVLLLNATLTVKAHEAGSHQKKGWEPFTDAVIKNLSDGKENLIFLLWGRFAQKKASLIDADKHHILEAAHPSPFSAYNGFFGCNHFSKTNEILSSLGLPAIEW
ncbi:MAG: uracil-DNA glycosylase [Flavobacteriales bacterium]|nr:uracil-DNA glycosylase [Flavobacteriales bacterium]